MTTPAPDDTAAEAVARTVLSHLHRIEDPSPAELDAALRQVDIDPDGSAAIAIWDIPADRQDLRTARAEGRYLPSVDVSGENGD